ncbi:MAG: hypothetical protein DCF27_08885 [Lysobacteraceae bacterium]|nr:MAG: hypothetical protein DCF27_08885 [Xanthomonadaceae bacterium]
MTFSSLKIHLALVLALAGAPAGAATTTPAAGISAAQQAIAAAERAQPRGDAGATLAQAKTQLEASRAMLAKRKQRDAIWQAELAAATADLARSQAQRDTARAEVESKSARNADLRRRLLVNRGNG